MQGRWKSLSPRSSPLQMICHRCLYWFFCQHCFWVGVAAVGWIKALLGTCAFTDRSPMRWLSTLLPHVLHPRWSRPICQSTSLIALRPQPSHPLEPVEHDTSPSFKPGTHQLTLAFTPPDAAHSPLHSHLEPHFCLLGPQATLPLGSLTGNTGLRKMAC